MGGERAREDHHDPTAGVGGAPPARSALTLRLVLALFGLLVGVAATVAVLLGPAPDAWAWATGALTAAAAVNVAVVLRRKRRGEPG